MDSTSVLTVFSPLPDFPPLASISSLSDLPLALRLLQLPLDDLPRAGFSRDNQILLSNTMRVIEGMKKQDMRPMSTYIVQEHLQTVKGMACMTMKRDADIKNNNKINKNNNNNNNNVQTKARSMFILTDKISLLSACCCALLSSGVDGRGVISNKAASVWISVVANLEVWEAVVAEQEKAEQSETSSRLMRGAAAGGPGLGAGADPHGWAVGGDAKREDDDDDIYREELREYTAKEVRVCRAARRITISNVTYKKYVRLRADGRHLQLPLLSSHPGPLFRL